MRDFGSLDCELIEQPDGNWKCHNCGEVQDSKVRVNCRVKFPLEERIKAPTNLPSVEKFLVEGVDRSLEEIKKIQAICFECRPHWDEMNGGCKAFWPACRRLAQTEVIWRKGRCVLRPEWRKWG